MKENPVCNKLEFGIKLLGARWADTVTELCFRIIPNIDFHLMPVSVIITNIFAVRAYGEQTFQRLNINVFSFTVEFQCHGL
jgi:hypothetical protein